MPSAQLPWRGEGGKQCWRKSSAAHLYIKSEHIQHWERGLAQWFPSCCHLARGSCHPFSREPVEDDIKICSLPSRDGESPDYTRGPSSLLG